MKDCNGNNSKNMASKPRALMWGSIILVVISIIMIVGGMFYPQLAIPEGQDIDRKTDMVANAVILFGSMMFGIAGGMITNIFTVYDVSPELINCRFDNIDTKLDVLEKHMEQTDKVDLF